jgi:phosphate starvation-inducible PhoH-like protein
MVYTKEIINMGGTMAAAEREMVLEFDDNPLLQKLVGEKNENLQHIEKLFQVKLYQRGNVITIGGDMEPASNARHILNTLYKEIQDGVDVDPGHIDGLVNMMGSPAKSQTSEVNIKANGGKPIAARTPNQAKFIEALQKNDLTFAIGPAGTGKTYLAVAVGVSMLTSGQVDRLVLCRPAVEAGEKLGFLPGDLKEQVDPFLRPIYDALENLFQKAQVEKLMANGSIEIAPLGFMRGRTLSNSYIILDEVQNTTIPQMKMFLTRLGEKSTMVVVGDVTQIDLPMQEKSGLIDASTRFRSIPGIGFVELTSRMWYAILWWVKL